MGNGADQRIQEGASNQAFFVFDELGIVGAR